MLYPDWFASSLSLIYKLVLQNIKVEAIPLLSLLFSEHTNSKGSVQAEKDPTQPLRKQKKNNLAALLQPALTDLDHTEHFKRGKKYQNTIKFKCVQPTANTEKCKEKVKALVDNPSVAGEAAKQINQPYISGAAATSCLPSE